MLAFQNAPPFAAPLRFFLTAPLFSLAAGLLLVVTGRPKTAGTTSGN